MEYANLPDRIKSFTVDQILLIGVMFLTSEVLNHFENVPTSLRVILFISYFFLYEPICIALFKGTVGHQFINVSVVKTPDPSRSLHFFSALIRTLLKYFLGWISLLTISGSDKRQAIHDRVVSSIVLRN